jgi:hypothetical protein
MLSFVRSITVKVTEGIRHDNSSKPTRTISG